MKRYEVYDFNDEVIDSTDDIREALSCAESYKAKFVFDTENNQIVFGSTEIIKVRDLYGKIIHKGDRVIWIDPETGQNSEAFEVYEEPTSEMVKLWNEYSECEALPEECVKL